MSEGKKGIQFLSRLAHEQVEDIIAMTDEEVLREENELGDANATARRMRSTIADAVKKARGGE